MSNIVIPNHRLLHNTQAFTQTRYDAVSRSGARTAVEVVFIASTTASAVIAAAAAAIVAAATSFTQKQYNDVSRAGEQSDEVGRAGVPHRTLSRVDARALSLSISRDAKVDFGVWPISSQPLS